MIAEELNTRSDWAPMLDAKMSVTAAAPVMATPLVAVAGVTVTAAAFAAGFTIGATAK